MVRDEIAEDLLGPIQQGMVGTNSGLEVTQEAVKERMGHEKDQPEGGDGGGVMAEVMVGVPLIAEFVESLVFDAPAFMAEENEGAGRNFAGGKRGDPQPLSGQLAVVPVVSDAFADGGGFDALDDADRLGV